MAQRYLLMLVADALELRSALSAKRHPRLKNRLLRLGEPLIERAGVTQRRILWAHDFPEDIPDGDRLIEFDDDGAGGAPPVSVTMRMQPDFPANWRFPLTP